MQMSEGETYFLHYSLISDTNNKSCCPVPAFITLWLTASANLTWKFQSQRQPKLKTTNNWPEYGVPGASAVLPERPCPVPPALPCPWGTPRPRSSPPNATARRVLVRPHSGSKAGSADQDDWCVNLQLEHGQCISYLGSGGYVSKWPGARVPSSRERFRSSDTVDVIWSIGLWKGRL